MDKIDGVLTLGASQTGEILNMGDDEFEQLSDADQERLAWAEDEVQNRLYRMGEPRS